MLNQKIIESFNKKNILVTGGTGMIGRQVVRILSKTNSKIRIVSLDDLIVDKKAEHVLGDLTNFAFCKNITEGMDYVFHIAGIGASVEATDTKIASHFVPMLMMNTNILEACRINKVEKVVYTSSVGAYAQAEVFVESEYSLDSFPMDFGGWAKRMAEAQIHAYKIEHGLSNYSIVRPSNVYGPGDNFNPKNSLVIPSLMYRIYHKEDPLVVWGDGSAVRDFVYSEDVAEGIILALYYGTNSGFVNLGSGIPCTIKSLVNTLQNLIGFNFVFDGSKPIGASRRLMDLTLSEKTIHYKANTKLADGLKKTWEWFIANPDEHKKKVNHFINAEMMDIK